MSEKRRAASCHPDRESAGYGLCGSCYQRTRRAGIEMPARSQIVAKAAPISADSRGHWRQADGVAQPSDPGPRRLGELGIRSSSVAVDQPASDLAWASWLIARDWADAL